jgi:hypothetical protein
MAIDRAADPADAPVETDKEQRDQDRRPPPDRPGAEGYPSRAESRAASAAADKEAGQTSDQASASIDDQTDSSPATSESSEVDAKAAGAESEASATATNGDAGQTADQSALEADEAKLDSPHTWAEKPGPETAQALPDTEPDAKVDSSGTVEMTEADSLAPADSRADGQIEDGGFRAISGEGLSDDATHAADLADSEVERGLLDRLKDAAARLDRGDSPREISDIVDQPDFQDPRENPTVVPNRYGRPLDRPDGTRTPLFNGEPIREQTQQGRLGDCGIISTLGAVAGHRPEVIRDCVRETDDGNYEVRLHETKFSASRMRYEPTGRAITLTITPELPVFNSDPDKPAFADSHDTGAAWSPVLEKAIAGSDQTWNDERRDKWEQRWKVQSGSDDTPNGYVRLHQGSNASERAELLTQLTGQPARTWEFPTGYDHNGRSADRQILDEFREQLAESKPILVGTRAKHKNEASLINDLKAGHAYEVTEVDDKGLIHLRNPWNSFHPDPLTVKEFRENIRPRYSTME